MPTTVEVPNVGMVEFPDSMSHDEIREALNKKFASKDQSEEPQTSGVGAFAARAGKSILPALGGAAGYAAATLAAPETGGLSYVVPILGTLAGSVAASKGQEAVLNKVAPKLQEYEQRSSAQHPIPALAGDIAGAATSFELAPGQGLRGLAAIAKAMRGTANPLQQRLAKTTAGTIGLGAGLGVVSPLTEGQKPTAAGVAESAAIPLLLGAPRFNWMRGALPRSTAEATKTGVPNASSQQQATEVHGNVRAQPGQGQGQVPAEVSSRGVQPQGPQAEAGKVGQQTQLPLSDEAQAHLAAAAPKVGAPVEVAPPEQEYDPNNAPFAVRAAGQFLGINRAKGTIQIFPEEFNKWLETVPKDQRASAVQSALDEERIHLGVSDEQAAKYWDNLTWAEKKIATRRYTRNWEGTNPQSGQAIPGPMLGHEALRFRIQQLNRMTPREIAEAAGKEKWTMQGITALESAIRSMRETLGTKASGTQRALLDRVQFNLLAAKQAVGGTPAALRKVSEDPKDMIDGVGDMTGREFAKWTTTLPKGYSPPARDLGRNLKDPNLLPHLQAKMQESGAKSQEAMQAGDFDEALAMANRRQFFREAYEAATGTGSAVTDLGKDPSYKPPFPQGAPAALRKQKSEPSTQGHMFLPPPKPGEEIERAAFPTPKASELEAMAAKHFESGLSTVGPAQAIKHSLRDLRARIKDKQAALSPEVKESLQERAKELEGKLAQVGSAEDNLSFAKFKPQVEREFGAGVGKDALYSIWQDALIKRLMNASAEEVGNVMQEMGLSRSVAEGLKPSDPNPYIGKGSIAEPPKPLPELSVLTPRGKKLPRQFLTKQLKARYAAVGAIMDRLNEAAGPPPARPWGRPTIGPEDIAQVYTVIEPGGETEEGDIRAPVIDSRQGTRQVPAEIKLDPARMGDFATKNAAVEASGKGAPPRTVSKNALILQDKATGKLVAVSTWRDPRTGPKVTDPLNSAKSRHIDADLLKNWDPMLVLPLREPIQGLRQEFANAEEFDRYFGEILKPQPAKTGEIEGTPGIITSSFVGPQAGLVNTQAGIRGAGTPPPAEAGLPPSLTETPFQSPTARDLPMRVRPGQAPYGARGIPRANIPPGAPTPPRGSQTLAVPEVEALQRKIAESFPEAEKFPEAGPREVLPGLGQPTGKVSTYGTPAKLGPGWPLRAGIEGTVAGRRTPAALNKQRQAVQDEMTGLMGKVRANFARHEKKQEIAAAVDAANTLTVTAGQNAKRNIEQPSSSTTQKRGNPKLLAAARAINALYDPSYKPGKDDPGYNYASPSVSAIAHPDPMALPTLLRQTREGQKKAQAVIDSPTDATLAAVGLPEVKGKTAKEISKLGRDWLKAAKELEAEVKYAAEYFDTPELMDTTVRAREEFGTQLAFEHANGKATREVENYLPGLYEGELYSDNAVTFSNIILGEAHGKPKTFANQYEAIAAGPYIPKMNSIADIAAHRVRSGMRSILGDQAFRSVLQMQDPATKAPVAIEAEITRDAKGVPVGGFQVPGGNLQYELVYPNGAGKPIAVRRGYAKLMNDLFGRSGLENWIGGKAALRASAIEKHTSLALDLYHLAKMGYYAVAISGRRAGFKGAHTALEFRPENMAEAVKHGVISQAEMDWALKPESVRLDGKTQLLTRQEILKKMQAGGFNVGRVQDAMYRHFVDALDIEVAGRKVGIGAYNRFLFDKWTRGLMANSAVEEFLRLQKKAPSVDGNEIMQRVIGDLNSQFGSSGKQGLIKNPTLRDLSQILLLAPQWAGTRISTEAKFIGRLASTPYVAATKGAEAANVHFGSIGKGVGTGLLTMAALTQALNLITRHQFTWQNEEEGHKLDAWIPDFQGGPGHWISPMSVYAEMTHDVARYMAGGENLLDTITHIAENKLQPIGRAAGILATGRTPTGQQITTMGRRLGETAKGLVPMPITASSGMRYLGSKVAPGLVSPPAPGATQRQLLASTGIKSELNKSPAQQIARRAKEFVTEEGLDKSTGWKEVQTDEPSYTKLRAALRNNDMKEAQSQYEAILEKHKPQDVMRDMSTWARRPFTGSHMAETLFKMSLTDKELELYTQAQQERLEELANFQEFYATH
jgi:hypothetical protein